VSARLASRLPFFYGWVIVAVAFVTMAFGVTARTSFSLLLPPLVHEFGWDRGTAAGAFSFGFLVSAVLSPVVGKMVDRHGPRVVIECGVLLVSSGLMLATLVQALWQLYATLGVLVGFGTNLMSFAVQSLYLPNWFVRRRGLVISLAFSGVGAGSVTLLPWLQTIILQHGWRAASGTLGVLLLCVLGPLNLLVRHRPADMGLQPDGGVGPAEGDARGRLVVVDPDWVAVDWTLGRAVRTGRFWWLCVGFFGGLWAWYAVQVHQTAYLLEIGFSPYEAAWALGLIPVVAIPGQIFLGSLSDRVGREWIWMAGCFGFVLSYLLLILMRSMPSYGLLYGMVVTQGFLGYALASVMGPIVVEIFEGPHFGTIFGTVMVSGVVGGAAGPFVSGVIHDMTGGYGLAFAGAVVWSCVSTAAIWIAAPRRVRMVPGKA
jgi:MFS family permease